MTNPTLGPRPAVDHVRWTVAGCAVAFTFAALTIMGWAGGLTALTNLTPGEPAMNPLTAVCILFASVSLWLARRVAPASRAAWAAHACAAMVSALAVLRLGSMLPGIAFPLDRVLFHARLLASPVPSQMGFNVALALACIGAALLLRDHPARKLRGLAEALLLAGLAVALMALVGYAYGARPMRGYMAVNTASALLLLTGSALAARPDRGLTKLVAGDSPGGAMARRVLPVALIAPIVLGWLRLEGERAGWFGLEIGTGMLVLALVSLLIGLTWLTARNLDGADRAQRAAEAALRTSLERHQRVLEGNLIGVLTVSPEGQIVEANRAFLDLLGYRREDLPLVPDAITPPEWRQLSETARQELAERGVATPFEKEYLHRDGHPVRVLVGAGAVPGAGGEVMAFVVDLTAKKQAELEVERMRLFLDSILEHLPVMMFVKDARDLRFVQFNRAGEELLGFSRDDLLGKNDYDFFPAAEADFFTAKDRDVLATRRLLDIPEEPIQTRRGETRILHTRKVPILDRDGTPRYLLGISEDITERKLAERQLAALNEGLRHRSAELEEANRELESFSYSVSHDLRAPLRHIDGFTDLLLRHSRPLLDDKGRRYLETIAGAAKSMGQLIDDLLGFSRMSRAQMQASRVDLGELVAEIRNALDAQGRSAEWRIAPLPVVQGDPAMLRLAFVNLLANALKYAGRRPQPVIEVGTEASPDEVVVFVRDNGVGFDMKYAHKLFGVFQRLHRDDEFEGTGIGLASVRRVIQRHNGRVWAEGEVDGGATFHVALPRPAAESDSQSVKEAA